MPAKNRKSKLKLHRVTKIERQKVGKKPCLVLSEPRILLPHSDCCVRIWWAPNDGSLVPCVKCLGWWWYIFLAEFGPLIADHAYLFKTTVYPSSRGCFQQDNTPSCQHGPKPLRNISSNLLNLCHKELRRFWRQTGSNPVLAKHIPNKVFGECIFMFAHAYFSWFLPHRYTLGEAVHLQIPKTVQTDQQIRHFSITGFVHMGDKQKINPSNS